MKHLHCIGWWNGYNIVPAYFHYCQTNNTSKRHWYGCFESVLQERSVRWKRRVAVYSWVPLDCNQRFVTRLDEWKPLQGSLSKEDMTPDVISEHPRNPPAVIEGLDGLDYVMTDKNEGGKHFDDALAKELASNFLWDLGEGLAQSIPGFPEEYFKTFIMVPSEDKEYVMVTYAEAYEKQNATKNSQKTTTEGHQRCRCKRCDKRDHEKWNGGEKHSQGD